MTLKHRQLTVHFVDFTQVCDSDTMLDPASSVEMVKVLEEDPMVGGVGGDVQVSYKTNNILLFFARDRFYKLSISHLLHLSSMLNLQLFLSAYQFLPRSLTNTSPGSPS